MLTIRPERVSDYAGIADLNTRAFGARAGEALVVTGLRQRTAFDPDLSLVAEVGGRLVGHALFSPYRLRLLDQTVPAVNLAPLAVDPDFQRQGVGGRLIAEGHAVAAKKGFVLSFLLGHVSYYPRFGYRTHAFGVAQVVVPVASLRRASLWQRGPLPTDLPALQALWLQTEAAVDFALEPGPALLDWLSPNPAVRSTVFLLDERVVGYTRIHAGDQSRPRVFLAWDAAIARAMSGEIAADSTADHLVLPIHPSSAAAPSFDAPVCTAWEAAMACALTPGVLDDYFLQVTETQRLPGCLTWPVAFDLVD